VGLAAGAFLEYPYLIEFTRQAISSNASITLTSAADHTPVLGWLITFWPVAGILVLGLFNRDRRSLSVFLALIWGVELGVTEFFYNHDVYGGVWERFNTTLKWWPWVYAGIVLTLGASNLGSSSRLCRYGTLALLFPTLLFAWDLGVEFKRMDGQFAGRLEGYGWIKDPVIEDFVQILKARPDGIAIESGLEMGNTDSPAIALFAGKMSLIGWPWHETTWRGAYTEIHERYVQNEAFYAGKLEDPLKWLLNNRVRYVIWLPRDNVNANIVFIQLKGKISSHYAWHHLYGEKPDFQVGFWERVDEIPQP